MPSASSVALSPLTAGLIIDQIVQRIAGGGTPPQQIKLEVAGAEWEVKRDDAGSARQRNERARPLPAALQREWGGEHEVRTYYGTAAAKMIADRLGKHLIKFLALADKAEPADIIDLLRASVPARAAAAAQDAIGSGDNEPPLPF